MKKILLASRCLLRSVIHDLERFLNSFSLSTDFLCFLRRINTFTHIVFINSIIKCVAVACVA